MPPDNVQDSSVISLTKPASKNAEAGSTVVVEVFAGSVSAEDGGASAVVSLTGLSQADKRKTRVTKLKKDSLILR